MIKTRFALLPLLLGALVALWLAILHVLPRPIEARWIDGIYRKKEAAAAKVAGPKVVLIGGSGTHYSYSAQVVSEATGLPVVNLGTHAGLGADYLLRRARRTLKPGDTAIVALEHQLIHQTPPSSILSTYVTTGDLSYLVDAPGGDVLKLVFGYSPVQLVRQLSAVSIPHNSPLYRPETVTAFGDESANTPENKLPYMAATVRALPAVSVAPPDPNSPPHFLRKFAAWAKNNDVRLLQAWTPTTIRPEYSSAHYTAYFEKFAETYRRLGFVSIGNPDAYLLPEEEMLDSMYHADTRGAARVSRVLARDLCQSVTCNRLPVAGLQGGETRPK